MKPETLKQILSERHPHINLNSSEMELVFHYLKEYHQELDKVILFEKRKMLREILEGLKE